MKNVKLLAAATTLLFAATGAFAAEIDGKADNSWLQQTAISQSAPAPTAAANGDVRVSAQSSQAVTP